MALVCLFLGIYLFVVFARVLLEWFRVPSDHPVSQVKRLLARAVDPIMLPLRRVVPSVPMGGARLDLSPILLFLGIRILMSVIC